MSSEMMSELDFDLADLKPLKGEVEGFTKEIGKLRRPYTRISEGQYNTLIARDADYYLTPTGQVVTFGTADQGYALMPLKEEKAEEIMTLNNRPQAKVEAEYCRVHAGMRKKEREQNLALLRGLFCPADETDSLFFVYNSTNTHASFEMIRGLADIDRLLELLLALEHGIETREFRVMYDCEYTYRLNAGPAIEIYFVSMKPVLADIAKSQPRLSGVTVPIEPERFVINHLGFSHIVDEHLKKQGLATLADEAWNDGTHDVDKRFEHYLGIYGSLRMAHCLAQIEALCQTVNLELVSSKEIAA